MSTPDLATPAHKLLHEQMSEWPALHGGYVSLRSVKIRTIDFDGFTIKLQYNPGRIISSMAKIDAKSLVGRKCFLCAEYRPPQQRSLEFGSDYLLLCNPFPIFPEHFTVAHKSHTPQAIAGDFQRLVDLARAMGSRYVALYNGPASGASAPDHLHFQAGTRGFMPIDDEYDRIKRAVHRTKLMQIFRSENYSHSFVSFESAQAEAIVEAFNVLVSALPSESGQEPMMNIIAYFDAGRWRIIVFPRTKHRPAFYFAEGDKRILLSPAAVEMGGVCTLPIERDFHRLTRDHVVQMYQEVCFSSAHIDPLCERLVRIV